MVTRWRTCTKFFLVLVLLCVIYYALLEHPYYPNHPFQRPPSWRTPDPTREDELSSESISPTTNDESTYYTEAETPDNKDTPTVYVEAEPQAELEDYLDTISIQDWPSITLATGLAAPVPYVSPGPYHVEYPSEYHFILDEPEKCQEQNPFLVLVVPVAPYNMEARDAVRSTWGSQNLVFGNKVHLFFLLGLPSGERTEQLQEKVLQESKEHQDLLQSDFIDSYKNLTIKTMVMMEWLSSRCPNASYAMKIDSDMFLNVHNLVYMLLLHSPKQNYMTGMVASGAAVLRDPSSKWYFPHEAFPEPVYPPYALGLGYVFTLDLPGKLVEASRHVKAIYIEDVYLGLCMRHLGIRPTNPPIDNLFQGYAEAQDRCHYMAVITTILYTHQELLDVWRDLHQPGPVCY
ncbi:beta-1,3-galactosyltransferase 1-like [Coregonus clupeaformis]|uniref:beta-1,3-galactosyltransferase 1-like n=1 Tax=Coregonus clupeaformis TaxID=59861 RepID=UPI001E1C5FE1|nr:beta-1,3-galactosyltransferase 1-like [Coregonus clupeaformis]